MVNNSFNNFRFEDEHLSEEILLMLVDGELSAKEASSSREHLEICWTCRRELEQIEETISQFVEFRKQIQIPLTPSPPNNWGGFNANLTKIRLGEFETITKQNISSAPLKTRWFKQIFVDLSRLFSLHWRRLSVAFSIALIAVVGWTVLERQSTLSAKAVLEEAEKKKLNWQYQPDKILYWEEEERLQNSTKRYRSQRWSNNLNGKHEILILRFDEQDQLVWGKWVKADGSLIIFQGKEEGVTVYPSIQFIKQKLASLGEEEQQILQKYLVSSERNIDNDQQAQMNAQWMIKNYTDQLVRKHEVEDKRKTVCVFIKADKEGTDPKVKASELEVEYDEQTLQRVSYRLTYFLKEGGSATEEARLLSSREANLTEFENNELARIVAAGRNVKYLSVEELVKKMRSVYLPVKK